MSDMLERSEFRTLTEGERAYVMDVMRREQPVCPGCGQPMRLEMEKAFDGKTEWWGRYACDWHTGCGSWGTKVERHPSIVYLAERCYKMATARKGGRAA